MTFQVVSNNKPRALLNAWELSAKEWQEFDYLGDQDSDDAMCAQFIRYKGELYYLGDFVRIEKPGQRTNPFCYTDFDRRLTGWEGILTDTHFSGIVIKWADDESVIVGRVFS